MNNFIEIRIDKNAKIESEPLPDISLEQFMHGETKRHRSKFRFKNSVDREIQVNNS